MANSRIDSMDQFRGYTMAGIDVLLGWDFQPARR